MTKSAKVGLGRSLVFLLIAIPATYLLGLGWVRTIAPVASPLMYEKLIIYLETAEFRETISPWPIVATVTYPNAGPIRGAIRDRAGGDRKTDYKITLSSPQGVIRESRCISEFHDACYFNADLGQTDLTDGVIVSITDVRDGHSLVASQRVKFKRTSSYSFALRGMLMSV